MELFEKLLEMTAIEAFMSSPLSLLMLVLSFILLYLGIGKGFEPLLLVPIAFGMMLANFPGGNMAVVNADQVKDFHLLQIAREYGIMNMLYFTLIKTGLLPPLIFMGVGAMTDFGPMLRNLRLAFLVLLLKLAFFL